MKQILLFTLVVLLLASLTGCIRPSNEEVVPGETTLATEVATEPVTEPATEAATEPAQMENFIGLRWERSACSDSETIYFSEDGLFQYSCSCGDPVNDADLCEGYTYDAEAGKITLTYMEEVEDAVTEILVKSCNGELLVLDFAGEERIFTLKVAQATNN